MPQIDFWYDFSSTYSYLAVMRIGELSAARGIAVRWRPFLLGAIFKAQGWNDTPFNLFPARGRYMVRDITRLAETRGLPFSMPPVFPQNSVRAARIGLIAAREGWAPEFTRAVFSAEFRDGADIADEAVMARAIEAAAHSPSDVLARSGEQAVKDELRAQTAEAQALGIFGAPSFMTADGELFWGDDRLEQALTWAAKTTDAE